MIEVILYSYKNKNLRKVVDSILNNTIDDTIIHVYDQHPIDRSSVFHDIDYNHIFWDKIDSPCELKGSLLYQAIASYVLVMSDDVILSPGWDTRLKEFINNREIVISGAGVIGVTKTDIFSIKPAYSHTDEYTLSHYAVREFIFASKNVWNKFSYPYQLKYNGEQEMLSLNIFRSGVDIYSAPTNLYEDLGLRTIENLYVPFSKDHKYNDVIDEFYRRDRDQYMIYSRWKEEFLKIHNIYEVELCKIPYINDDVSYRPEQLAFQDIDARKFISKTKAVY
jgi:hypothetical protein